jgi:hypothetical protein
VPAFAKGPATTKLFFERRRGWVQQEMMSTLPEIFLFPLSLSLSSGTGGEKEERERFRFVAIFDV